MPVDENFARRRFFEAGQHVEKGRLAATACTDDGHELVGLDVEGHIAKGEDCAVSAIERLRRLAKADDMVRAAFDPEPSTLPFYCHLHPIVSNAA